VSIAGLLSRAKDVAAPALTFGVNFWPWLLGAALAGATVAAVPTFIVTRAIFQRQALIAQRDLSAFTATLATNAANGQAEARRLQAAAHKDLAAWRTGIENRIDAGFADVRAGFDASNTKLRGLVSDQKYACLRLPLPADYVRMLARPAGAVTAGDHPDSGAATTASGVPTDPAR
jgi:hypothetical protein